MAMAGICESKKADGPGKGVLNFLKRLRHSIIINLIGTKWGLDEIFTKHRKLCADEIPERIRGETVVVTGGNRGIGAEVVKQCLQLDMNVIIGCRNPAAGKSLIESIRKQGIVAGSPEVILLDLNLFSSVQQFAQTILNKSIPIHLLINNAGVMFQPFSVTVDGFESQFQTNYLSHFLLTILLQPALHQGGKPNAPSRVVNVTSIAHYGGQIDFENIDMRKGYSPQMGYMSSKFMQVVSTIYLNQKYKDEKLNIRVYTLHPGIIRTHLYQYVSWVNLLGPLLNPMFKKPEQGADGVVFVAMSASVSEDGGTYYSNCKLRSVNPLALNRELQQKLYEFSVKLCDENDNSSAVFRPFHRPDQNI